MKAPIPTFVGKPKREWQAGPVVVMRPVRRVGKFYGDLNKLGKNQAKAFARLACSMSRPAIVKELARLASMAKYNNFEVLG